MTLSHWRGRVAILISVCAVMLPRIAMAATPDQVDAAIDRAKAYLLNHQKNSIWDKSDVRPLAKEIKTKHNSVYGGQWGGETALATFALLAAGESPQSTKLIAPIKFLRYAELPGTYAFSVRAQLYALLPPSPELRRSAQDDANSLLRAMGTSKSTRGPYGYLLGGKANRADHSVSQYAVLGMWACEQAGAEVPTQYWSFMENGWIHDQQPDGGWCYEAKPTAKNPVDASMTAAGVATLFITQDYLHADTGIFCTGNITNPHIDAGLKWMSDNFNHVYTDHSYYHPYYGLFGVERIGVASGLKYFGKVDWYQSGADWLVKNQHKTGSWGSVVNTSFALLFLSRGRAPIVFNKLQYDSGVKIGNWNERPRDAANATRFISKAIERDLNWQIIDLHADQEVLHEAPIMLITGNKPLDFSAEHLAKLRTYCQEGGIILGNADGSSPSFTASFRNLAKKLFPQYEMRQLPADSPVLTREQYPASRWRYPLPVESLSNGVREMMVLMPHGDPAKFWQLRDAVSHNSAFQFVDDLFLYSVDKKNLLEKGRTYLVNPNPKLQPQHTVYVARLQYPGNWDPEPAGWTRLAAIMHNTADINLRVRTIVLDDNTLGNGHGVGIKIASLTGTTRLVLSDAQKKELRKFVEGGGTLLVDAAGGSSEFAASAQQQLINIFGPDAQAQLDIPLPDSASIYHLKGGQISTFGYRQYARTVNGTMKGPQLRAIKVHGRPAVYFSRLDLGAGLVGEQVDGIVGYDPDTATAIVRNIVALGLGKNAQIQPTLKSK